ncbi:MAG TPA: chaperone modulator CbpM [Chitinophagaceae bacterium]|nr:chaperone modulator CbpM [Chitinophagaceae bacterium]
MDKNEMIAAHDFCVSHNVELSFLYSLSESGLVQITTIDEQIFITEDQLPGLEKWVRLHYDLDINIEGLEAIHHLLEQMKQMEEEMVRLRGMAGSR